MGASTTGAPTASTPDAEGAAPSARGQELVVHVVGQVAKPGVIRLPAGARVGEALEEAGGALATADLARVNLARQVVDGEQIVVPRPGEALASGALGPPAAGGASTPGGSGPASVSLNTADLAGLDSLPGIGPVLAQRILDWRDQHGSFSSVDELGEVSGIGDKLLEQLRPLVTV
jgi:competence protein ComEA